MSDYIVTSSAKALVRKGHKFYVNKIGGRVSITAEEYLDDSERKNFLRELLELSCDVIYRPHAYRENININGSRMRFICYISFLVRRAHAWG